MAVNQRMFMYLYWKKLVIKTVFLSFPFHTTTGPIYYSNAYFKIQIVLKITIDSINRVPKIDLTLNHSFHKILTTFLMFARNVHMLPIVGALLKL